MAGVSLLQTIEFYTSTREINIILSEERKILSEEFLSKIIFLSRNFLRSNKFTLTGGGENLVSDKWKFSVRGKDFNVEKCHKQSVTCTEVKTTDYFRKLFVIGRKIYEKIT